MPRLRLMQQKINFIRVNFLKQDSISCKIFNFISHLIFKFTQQFLTPDSTKKLSTIKKENDNGTLNINSSSDIFTFIEIHAASSHNTIIFHHYTSKIFFSITANIPMTSRQPNKNTHRKEYCKAKKFTIFYRHIHLLLLSHL